MTRHWHRASVNPMGLTKDQVLEAAQTPELSIRQFASAKMVMQITGLMEQWTGPFSEQWSEWCIAPYRAIRHSIRLSTLSTTEQWPQEVIYFPMECDGNCE